MHASCAAMRRLLYEQSDRTLTTGEMTELRTHLATCPGCRAFERDLHAGLASIARLPRVNGSRAVREVVLAGVHPGGRSAWPRGWRDWTGQSLKLVGAMTAFALVAVVLMSVFSGAGSGEPDERFSGTGGQLNAPVEPTATPEPTPSIPAESSSPLACTGAQVSFETSIDSNPGDRTMTPGSPGIVAITVHALRASGGVECRLTTPVTLTIEDEAGRPLDITSNGLTVPLDVIVPSDNAFAGFAWLNWCGATEARVVFVVDLANWGFMSTHNTPGVVPPCDDSSRPSSLGQMGWVVDVTPVASSTAPPATTPTVTPTVPTLTPTAPATATTVPLGLAACALEQYARSLQSSGAAAGSVGYHVEAVGQSAACWLDTVVTITFLGADSQPLPIDSNGMTLPLVGVLPDGAEAGVLWANWCGERESLRVEISTPDHTVQSDQAMAPGCNEPGQPSTLFPMPAEEP